MTQDEVSVSMIKVTVLLFAKARELAGVSSLSLNLPSETSPQVAFHEILLSNYPDLRPLADHCLLAVNHNYVQTNIKSDSTNYILKDGDELAIIPPISGG